MWTPSEAVDSSEGCSSPVVDESVIILSHTAAATTKTHSPMIFYSFIKESFLLLIFLLPLRYETTKGDCSKSINIFNSMIHGN